MKIILREKFLITFNSFSISGGILHVQFYDYEVYIFDVLLLLLMIFSCLLSYFGFNYIKIYRTYIYKITEIEIENYINKLK